MVDLPPVAGVQPRRQLIAYDTAGQVPVAQPQGAGQLGPILQAVMQGGQAVAEGFSLPEMMAQYARATDPVASRNMSGLERLFATNPAINTMAGGIISKLPQGAVLGSSALRRQGDKALPQVDEIVAYHGSPHDFDKFQMDKIGTGEGAQAFGHGLYFSDLEDIATSYKDKLTQTSFVTVDGQAFDPYKKLSDGSYTIKNLNVRANLNKNDGDIDKAIQRATDIIEKVPDEEAGILAAQDLALLENIKARGGLQTNKGKTYKVRLSPQSDELLDFDLPLEQQPDAVKSKVINVLKKIYPNVTNPALSMKGSDLIRQVQNALVVKNYEETESALRKINTAMKEQSGIINANSKPFGYRQFINEKGAEAAKEYDRLLDEKAKIPSTTEFANNSDREASKLLSEQGIKGLKYRANRGGGASTNIDENKINNYVIFDENLIKILAKYGIVGGAGLAAANEFSSPAQADSYPNYMPPQAPELDANPLPTLPPNMV
tara:strand:- start:994 stop:2463 length:1470 start_codon:yes stop_codon:yes gene_type:complete